MESSISSFHPYHGWRSPQDKELKELRDSSSSDMVGKHFILELYECDRFKLNDEAFVRTVLTSASKISGARILNLITHKFCPQGVTGLVLLAESHMSIHTWPESKYAAVDVFTCGNHTMPEKACELLAKEFSSSSHYLRNIHRAIPSKLSNASRMPE